MSHPQKYNAPKVLTCEHTLQMATLHTRCFKKGWSRDFFETIITSSTGLALGVFDQRSRLRGFCLSRWIMDEAEILTIVVDSESRQQRLGTHLLSTTCHTLKSNGAHKIFLEVFEKNEVALALYDKLGFKPIGLRANYYFDTEEKPGNAVVLELFLNKCSFF